MGEGYGIKVRGGACCIGWGYSDLIGGEDWEGILDVPHRSWDG